MDNSRSISLRNCFFCNFYWTVFFAQMCVCAMYVFVWRKGILRTFQGNSRLVLNFHQLQINIPLIYESYEPYQLETRSILVRSVVGSPYIWLTYWVVLLSLPVFFVFADFHYCKDEQPFHSPNPAVTMWPWQAYSIAFHPSGFHLIIGQSDKLRLMNLLMEDGRVTTAPTEIYALGLCAKNCAVVYPPEV